MQKKAVKEAGEIENAKIVETAERAYELRDLKDKDLFPLLNILKKIGIKDFKNAFIQNVSTSKGNTEEAAGMKLLGEEGTEENVQERINERLKSAGIMVAIDMAAILIENLPKAENEIYSLWADISGIPEQEIKEMEFGTLPLMVLDTFSRAGNASFFKVLSKFI